MTPDHDDLTRIRRLGIWRGAVSVEPLSGGITNRNYRVTDSGRSYAARLCVDRPLLGIDRRNEVACQRAAHGFGVAPETLHHEDGVLISAYLPARTLAPADVRKPDVLPRLAEALRALHGPWDRLAGDFRYFCAFQASRSYARTARKLGARLPSDLDELIEDAAGLSRRMAPFLPTLCHNDLLAGNILEGEGGRVWLVDWEYAGIGNPLFDLAGAAANSDFPEPLEAALLKAYRGSVDERELLDLRILRAVSSLREALWALIQSVASDLDFDYLRYSDDNLASYRDARCRLGLTTAVPR